MRTRPRHTPRTDCSDDDDATGTSRATGVPLRWMTMSSPAAARSTSCESVPWIEPSDVAEAIRFLVSDRARYMTGTTFVIDAGLLTR